MSLFSSRLMTIFTILQISVTRCIIIKQWIFHFHLSSLVYETKQHHIEITCYNWTSVSQRLTCITPGRCFRGLTMLVIEQNIKIEVLNISNSDIVDFNWFFDSSQYLLIQNNYNLFRSIQINLNQFWLIQIKQWILLIPSAPDNFWLPTWEHSSVDSS